MIIHLRASTERVSRIPLKSGTLSFGRETRSHWCWLEGRKGPPGIACKIVQHIVGTTRLFLFKQDSQGHSLSLLCFTFFRRFVCVPCFSASLLFPSFHLSSLSGWLCYECHSGGAFGISKLLCGGVVFVLGGYLWPSRTFIWCRIGTCYEGSWLRLWKSVLRH